METQIVNLLLQRMLPHLKDGLITNVAVNDPSRAKIVKIGLLQTSKVQNVTSIGIIGGDHENPAWRDGIVSIEDMENVAQDFPAREVGGGQLWWRRGTAVIECFHITTLLSEEEAFEASYATLGRLMSLIESTPLSGLRDDFDESAIKIYCPSNTFFQSGGPPNQYIFRGKVFWMMMTERP